jgi:hypothetical protein
MGITKMIEGKVFYFEEIKTLSFDMHCSLRHFRN